MRRPPVYITSTYYLQNAYGRLASLAGIRGFRRYIKVVATEVGITGSVRRTADWAVKIVAEGTEEQIDAFIGRLRMMYKQNMMESYEQTHYQVVGGHPLHAAFSILPNLTSGKTNTGEHSGDDFNCEAMDYSSDSQSGVDSAQPKHDSA